MSNESSSSSSSGGIGFCGLLGILFIALKLLHVINWSWWWVTAPLWGGLAIFAAIGLIILFVYLLACLLDYIGKRRRRA